MNQTKLPWRKLARGCGLLVLLPCSLFALDPSRTVFQFSCQSWMRQDGLPANGVNAITQTKDGFLWVGTQIGFVRFDGDEFKLFNLPDKLEYRSQVISSLAPSRNGGLWFGIRNGSIGFFDEKAGFTSLQKESWVDPAMNVISLREASDGAVWIGTDRGIARWVKGNTNETRFYDEVTGVTSVYEDSHHRVWLGTVNEGLYYWEAGKMQSLPDPALKQTSIFSLAEDPSGQIWVGTPQGLRCYNAGFQAVDIPPFYTEVKTLLVDSHGVLWIGTTGEGLQRYYLGKFSALRRTDGLSSDNVTSLYEDHEGNLWVGTRNGLNLLSDVKLPIYAASEGLLGGGYHDVCASTNGGLWTATSRGVSYFDGIVSSNYSSEAGISVPYVKRVFEASDGDLYLVNGNREIEILSQGKVVVRYANTNWPTALAEDSHGVVVSVGGDLFRVSRNQYVPYVFKEGSTPEFYWIRNLSTCRDHTILVATVNGVFRIGDGVFEHWSVENGLSDRNVLWASEDDQHNVWLAMTTGIGRLSGNRIQNLSRDNGLFDNFINAIVPDDRGWIWMNSSRGIFRVSRQSLDGFFKGRISRVDCVAYDGQDAVKTIDTTEVEYTGCRTADGRIWFPSPQGLVMIDPTNLVQSSVAPPVHIERVSINGVELDARGPSLSVKPGKGELEVQYTGVSFVANQRMLFRYRLDGYEPRWTDAGTRRSAFYTNLKPGNYRFVVQACNADGIWNTAGDQFTIELPPHMYQTGWFRTLCAASGVAVLLAVILGIVRYHQRRQRNLQQANEVLESKIRDRTRELAEQRNLLRTLIDHLPDNVFVKDTQGRVVIGNIAHARMLGFADPEAAVGRTDFDCFPRKVAEKFFADEQKLLKSGGSYDAEEKILDHKTGETRWLRTTKVPLHDSTGQIIGLAGIHRDITERKRMEEEVEDSHKQLLQVSRKAGMAEVAASVLHNVGNVLNSVNVSTSLLGDNIRQSKASSLMRAASLLREHAADLGEYLTKDPKGRQLPDYLLQLGTFLAEEQKVMLKEIDLVRKNVEHIKDIVTTQQTYAKVSGVIEKISVAELVEDALRINANALSRHDVLVTRDFDPQVPEIMLDKHKVLQILVNLIRNAKYACDDSGRNDKQLTVRVARSEDQVRVVVADNGVGIPAENLTRIFNHGFTTRKDGHGFGLHSGALAAKEMGGTLTAESAGPNQGATFVLQLPMEHKVAPIDPHADAPKIIGHR